LLADTLFVAQVLIAADLGLGSQGQGKHLLREAGGFAEGDIGFALTTAAALAAGQGQQDST